MQITDILEQAVGLQAIARELGISEADAARGAAALGPAVLGGFKKQAQAQPSGVEGFEGLLGQLGGGSLLENVLAPEPTDVSRGDDVLGQIFGSRDVSRTVAADASGRTREIRVRMALGATASAVRWLVMSQGVKVVLAGLVLGVGAALASTRLLSTLLYNVKAVDPVMFGAMALVMTAIGMLACYMPARRASKVDPILSLRGD